MEANKNATATEQRDLQADLRISIDPQQIVRLLPFIAVRDLRYYLCGVRVEPAPHGIHLVATDGHTLGVVNDASGSCTGGTGDGAIVRITPALATAVRAAASFNSRQRVGGKLLRVLVRGTRVLVAPTFDSEGTDAETFVQPGCSLIDGKYPDWRRVLPDFAQLQRGAMGRDGSMVNSTYMARLDKITPAYSKGVVLWQVPGSAAIVVQLDGVPEMVAVIMEMRGRSNEAMRQALPAVHRAAAAAPAVAAAPADAECVNRDAVPA